MGPANLACGPAGREAARAVESWWDGAATDLSDPARALAALHDADRNRLLELPLPLRGSTADRWAGLAALGAADLTLARLAEAHLDAVAILDELGGPSPGAGRLWGVWAAEPPGVRLDAAPAGSGWRLAGTKTWCSGAAGCDAALVTAAGPDGPRLLAVDLHQAACTPGHGTWQAVGLTGSDTEPMLFDDAAATAVGGVHEYVQRPGFWVGAAGVAAVWWGGAVGVAKPLYVSVASGRGGPHARAHLGAVDAALAASAALLTATATAMDAAPGDIERSHLLAARARVAVEVTAVDVLDRVGRALGPGPLCTDRAHARRAADLTVYLRQSHAERDLEELGALAAAATP